MLLGHNQLFQSRSNSSIRQWPTSRRFSSDIPSSLVPDSTLQFFGVCMVRANLLKMHREMISGSGMYEILENNEFSKCSYWHISKCKPH